MAAKKPAEPAKKRQPAKKTTVKKTPSAKPASKEAPPRAEVPVRDYRANRHDARMRQVKVDSPELQQAVGAATEVFQLSPKLQIFVAEYLASRVGYKAYKAAFPDCSWNTARSECQRIMAIPEVSAAISAGMVSIARNIEWSADEVARRFARVATADARDLVQIRVGCCRYCWGEGHRYQYTPAEMERAEAEHSKLVELDKASGDFDPKGGPGFERNAPPNPSCPECGGDGMTRVVFKDSAELTDEQAALFAGAKVTKDGLEIKLHDQQAALVNLGRVIGAFKDKLEAKVEHSLADEFKAYLADRGGSRLPVGEP